MRRRAAALRSWLWQRSEERIVLVSHGAFLHYLTEDWTGYVKAHGTVSLLTLKFMFPKRVFSNYPDGQALDI